MIEISSGAARLVLAPELGGAVASYEIGGRPVFHPVADPALTAQRGNPLAAYPLIPFSNRVAWGRFAFEGQTYQLARNFGDHPHTIHGNAWMHPWTVVEQRDGFARLEFSHLPPRDDVQEWPFAYTTTIDYALSDETLEVTIVVENLDERRQPVGFGFHPYYPRGDAPALGFKAETVWHTNDVSLPDARLPLTGNWSFDPMRAVDGPPIDNCFNGWFGFAALRSGAGHLVSIAATPPFQHLVVFTPDGKDYLAVEPASNMTDAINHPEQPDQGLHVLEPGARLTGRVTITVETEG